MSGLEIGELERANANPAIRHSSGNGAGYTLRRFVRCGLTGYNDEGLGRQRLKRLAPRAGGQQPVRLVPRVSLDKHEIEVTVEPRMLKPIVQNDDGCTTDELAARRSFQIVLHKHI